jgi:hypothetical protein
MSEKDGRRRSSSLLQFLRYMNKTDSGDFQSLLLFRNVSKFPSLVCVCLCVQVGNSSMFRKNVCKCVYFMGAYQKITFSVNGCGEVLISCREMPTSSREESLVKSMSQGR